MRGPGEVGAAGRRGTATGVSSAAALVVAALAAAPAPAAPQHPHPPDVAADSATRAFVDSATLATRRFADRRQAIRAGYRRLGPDFPGMGEHWIHPGRIVRGVLDPSRPSVLSYVEMEGEPVLVGLAFTLPLGPEDAPPTEPFGVDVWHDHSGAVDEETLLLNHPSSMHDDPEGPRLSMVHVWTDLENPDGVLAQNNWRLPWIRVGLAPPHASMEAARGVSLAYGGRAFYAELIRRAADLTPAESEAVAATLDRHASEAERRIELARDAAEARVADPSIFADLWRSFWDGVRDEVRPDTWRHLAPLADDPLQGHGSPAAPRGGPVPDPG